jgi:hypothetical protein
MICGFTADAHHARLGRILVHFDLGEMVGQLESGTKYDDWKQGRTTRVGAVGWLNCTW